MATEEHGLDNVKMLAQMARTYALTCLEQAIDEFKRAPAGGNNWHRLQVAMLVYQQSYVSGNQAALAKAIADTPIGQWGEAMVKAVSGTTIEEVLGGR